METLKPIVINLPTRGACAVDYIDYFDEGRYGPDKPFFIKRFSDFDEVAAQMNMCLQLQTTEGSLIHGTMGGTSIGRLHIENKWVEPLIAKNTKYPQRAQYKIRFMIRIKFYGEFSYIDIGAKWKAGDDEDPERIIVILPEDLEIVNYCCISREDAQYILDKLILKRDATGKSTSINYDGTQTYSPDGTATISTNSLIEKYLNQKENDEKAASAVYIGDDNFVLTDDEGLITIE
jgi:hypothetical protein